jgi:choline dehydrogenase-like flavoprotein
VNRRRLPMSASPNIPEDPSAIEWDVAVIGTGMGGAVAGYGLAKLGRRVLFIEKGLFFHGEFHLQKDGSAKLDENLLAQLADRSNEQPKARLRRGWWPLRLQGRTSFGELEFFAPLGCGSGGSTSLYAAALERFWPADFRPRANFPQVSDSTLPEKWPITYEDLRPFYIQAETLFRVRGTPDPLGHGEGTLRHPPNLSPRDHHLFESFEQLGLHPYRVHVGYEYVDGCEECEGLCHRGCKNDSGRICLLPALQKYGASILPQCEVLKLEAGKSEVRQVLCRWNGVELSIRAKMVVLGAGAFMTPVLLLNSKSEEWPDGLANRSGLVGRYLMLHASDFIAVRPTKRLSIVGPQKSLAFNDFYYSDGEKLGTFQTSGGAVSVGRIMQYMRDAAEKDPTWWRKLASPRPVWWRKLSSPVIRLIALTAYHLFNFKNAAVWASAIEDLPYYENRVIPDPQAKNGMRFEYRYPEELRARVMSFRKRLAKALGPHKIIVLSGENNLNFGHVCGTCRFGDDPATSVLDKNNRAHDISNLYVVDASFFPSSGGTNPSLTIAANALRVAESIHKQLG